MAAASTTGMSSMQLCGIAVVGTGVALAAGASAPALAVGAVGGAAIGGVASVLSRVCLGGRRRHAEVEVQEEEADAQSLEASGIEIDLGPFDENNRREEKGPAAGEGKFARDGQRFEQLLPASPGRQNDGVDPTESDAAIAASLAGNYDDSFDEKAPPSNAEEKVAAVYAASRREQKYDPALQNGYKCAVEMVANGINPANAQEIMGLDNIPQNFLLFLDGDPVHAGHLALYSLAHPEPRDHHQRPLTPRTFLELARRMGVDQAQLETIWVLAEINDTLQGIQVDQDGEITDVTADNRRKNRLEQLHTLLISEHGTPEQLIARANLRFFLQEQDVWKSQFPNG